MITPKNNILYLLRASYSRQDRATKIRLWFSIVSFLVCAIFLLSLALVSIQVKSARLNILGFFGDPFVPATAIFVLMSYSAKTLSYWWFRQKYKEAAPGEPAATNSNLKILTNELGFWGVLVLTLPFFPIWQWLFVKPDLTVISNEVVFLQLAIMTAVYMAKAGRGEIINLLLLANASLSQVLHRARPVMSGPYTMGVATAIPIIIITTIIDDQYSILVAVFFAVMFGMIIIPMSWFMLMLISHELIAIIVKPDNSTGRV